MENKQTAPKEIYTNPVEFSQEDFTDGGSCMIGISEYPVEPEDVRYLSESHVKELLAEKEREIEQLKNARKSENLTIYTQFIASEDAEIQNITYYDFVNKGHVQHECKASVKAGHTYQVIQEGDKLRLEDITPIENLLKNN